MKKLHRDVSTADTDISVRWNKVSEVVGTRQADRKIVRLPSTTQTNRACWQNAQEDGMSVLIPSSIARDGHSWKIALWSVQCGFTAVIGRKSSRDSSMTAPRSLREIGKLSAYFHPLSFSAYQFDTHRDEFKIPIPLACFSSENNHPMKDVLMPKLTEPLKV